MNRRSFFAAMLALPLAVLLPKRKDAWFVIDQLQRKVIFQQRIVLCTYHNSDGVTYVTRRGKPLPPVERRGVSAVY